ncbi:MAG: hypothetical protein H6751_14855 [Candidatus Omnitrophica bacterium]|nr:hypothetical protein [Candidatus Omnitrophota bacterium]
MAIMGTSSGEETMEWHDVGEPGIQICGLPFFAANDDEWWRFPQDSAKNIPDYVWETSKASSGARLRFRTDSSRLALRMEWISIAENDNLHRYGAAGLDAYVDGEYLRTVVPPSLVVHELDLFSGVTKKERDICLYLPLFSVVKVIGLGINEGSNLASPEPFTLPDPVVFYGTSITHGGCAARPGLSYPAIACRDLNLDFVNFGLNGCGRGEAEVAKILARVKAACFVLDYSQNNPSAESLKNNYAPFIRILRKAQPEVPIICVTPIYWTPELSGTEGPSIHEELRQVIRDAVSALRGEGIEGLFLVEGNRDMLSPEKGDGLTDGLHPNSLGFHYMARGISKHLSEILFEE